MPNNEVIELCENIIIKDFGDLSDIPYELANSIANTYYKFFKLSNEIESNSIWENKNIFEGAQSYSKQLRKLQLKIDIIPNLITQLRKINQLKQPNMYKLWLNVSLDYLKYDIEHAMKKSGIRRAIERKLKNVDEIPNLIDSLGLKKNDDGV